MVGPPEGMEGGIGGNERSVTGLLKSFASPSTLPHFLAMMIITGLLYVMMKVDIFGIQERGAVIFLSLSLSYCIAAIFAPSKIGGILLRVDHQSRGVIGKSYWKKGAATLFPIVCISAIVSFVTISQAEEWLGRIAIALGMIFVLMSIFQAITLAIGLSTYGTRVSKKIRPSRIGFGYSALRIVAILVLFCPIIWWFGYDAGDYANISTSEHLAWALFLILIGSIMGIVDRITSTSRKSTEIDGVIADRVAFLLSLTACWHVFSAWRRMPFFSNEVTPSMIVEEGLLMAITILLAVWAMANKNSKKGVKIFQGQSAVFWGISFGYVYAGSISSLSALSKGSLLTTTAFGHILTALVIVGITPIAVFRIRVNATKDFETFGSDGSNGMMEEAAISEIVPQNNEISLEMETVPDEDTIELID